MKITLSTGKTFEVNYIWGPLRGTNQIMIDMPEGRGVEEVAADFAGVASIVKTDARRPGVEERYEGYTEIASVIRERATGTVRITLERP